MAAEIESLTLKRVAYRFIPFLMLCYFVNYLDRVNVGFAKLTMDADLGLSIRPDRGIPSLRRRDQIDTPSGECRCRRRC